MKNLEIRKTVQKMVTILMVTAITVTTLFTQKINACAEENQKKQ